jgi:hypothetical protein
MQYIITYSNHFKIENSTFAFRKKELFCINKIPQLKNKIEVSGCKGYWLKGKFYSLSKLEKIVIKQPIEGDVSDSQWHKQIELDEVFNLNK